MSDYVSTIFDSNFISCVVCFFGLFLLVWIISLAISEITKFFRKI